MIRQEAAKQFDPNLATTFLELHPRQGLAELGDALSGAA
jgi:hypothetical protein